MKLIKDIDTITESIIGLHLKLPILFISLLGGFTIGSLSGFVTDWIYTPAISFYALIGVLFADYILGIIRSLKSDSFETRKATRILYVVISHTFLLSAATNLSKGSETIYWLDEGIFVPLVLVNLLSVIKNLALLGYIKSEIADYLYRKIDVYKNPSSNPNP